MVQRFLARYGRVRAVMDLAKWSVIAAVATGLGVLAVIREVLAWSWQSQLMLGIAAALIVLTVVPWFLRTPIMTQVAGFLRLSQSSPESQASSSADEVGSSSVQTGIQFFRNRADMETAGLGLGIELQQGNRLWCSFETGYQLYSRREHLRKVDRLVLMDPHCCLYDDWVGMSRPIEEMKGITIQLTQLAQSTPGMEVRWSKKPMLNVIIGEPHDDNAWARVVAHIPYGEAEDSPIYKVAKLDNPKLFGVVRDAYLKMWEDSRVPC